MKSKKRQTGSQELQFSKDYEFVWNQNIGRDQLNSTKKNSVEY